MNFYKTKSEYNLAAAKSLLDEDNPVSSVHCAYYGCFQLVKFKLGNLGHSFEEIDNKIAASSAPNKLSTHGYPRHLLYTELKNRINDSSISARDFNNKIKRLKLYREESDYYNIKPSPDKGKEAYILSEEIVKLINKI